MVFRQWEQDYIHELIERGLSIEAILRECRNLPRPRLEAVAARYREFLAGDSPTPYLDGTVVYADSEALNVKPRDRKSSRQFWGETNGEQVF
jgi:hypothetical protein